ncbi:DUF2946 family protein [Bradyrhizobium sp. LHD-71]|uniref:DUF2946 family protein n=1 Tax=Bradyrhizobium sp. LHD-71 TaxID=3072141 RepID=UPI00280D4E34|nr:DUF2946 family protein [Bradyrhizobium sp. LHD-71]MDQ8726633.1 hypothetical protein [Bradyrhizobium sp. LHD-71]
MSRRKGWTAWIALVAAYAFAIQSLFAAFAIGASATPSHSEIQGAIFCIANGETAPTGDAPPNSRHLLDCCTLACGMFAAAVDAPPDAAAVPLPPRAQAIVLFPAGHESVRSKGEGRLGNPRAPPLMI